MWKGVRPLEEGKQCIRYSAVYRDGKFPLPTPTSAIISQGMLSPWWLSSSGHMSQAEALATGAWCGSGRNRAIEYFWGRKQRAVQRVKPKHVSRTARSISNTQGPNHRRGTVEQVDGRGARKRQWDRVGSVSSSAITWSQESLLVNHSSFPQLQKGAIGKMTFGELFLVSYSVSSYAHLGRRKTQYKRTEGHGLLEVIEFLAQ